MNFAPENLQVETMGAAGRFASAYRILSQAIAGGAFPGCTFGVLAAGVAYSGALGRFTYEQDSPAVLPETVYDVASLTKVVATTAAAMLMVERGRMDLDSPLARWLPAFAEGRKPADPALGVTLRHLLAHNSGLPGYVEFFRTAGSPDQLLDVCLKLPLGAAPGERAEYSDPGFILLGKALEACAGEDLARFTSREIYGPSGMSSTGFCPPAELRNFIPPTEYDRTFRRRRIQGEVQDENAWLLGGVAGHAGLFSSTLDLLRFAARILSGASQDHAPREVNALFSHEIVERFARLQPPQGSSRALGWDTPSENSSTGRHFSARSIGHLGYSGCSLWIDLDARIAAVLLTNRTWPDRSSQAIRQIRPAFHDALREAL
jgi:CubicO group peptidase (beta-lactamase class C family)